MVGFVRESVKEEDNVVSQSKLKASANDSESFKFDFDCYSTDFDELSVPSAKLPLDFDIFEDWIGEMQEPVTEVETGNGVNSCLENLVGSSCVSDFTQDMKDLEKTGSVNVVCGGTDESTVCYGKDIDNSDNVLKSCGMDNFMKPESDVAIKQNGSLRDESCIRVLDHESNGKLDGLGCSIEEGLKKVSLVGNEGSMVVCMETEIASVGVENDSDSDSGSESESEATTSSSSASSSSSESDDDDDDEVESTESEKSSKSNEQRVDMEEGEIVGSDTEKMASRSDDDDDEDSKVGEIDDVFEDGDDDEDISDIPKGPIKSKNELVVLPPVPPVTVTLQPGHQILPVGAVVSTLGAQVVVEGSEKHSPLSEGSILWISETRSPLGLVDEIFGPVKSPFYIVRFNTESEVPSGLRIGSLIGFVQDFVDHVLNDKTIYQKGYDASGDNDEELMDEVEFSDDEKEAEYKRTMKMSKRGNTNQGFGNKKNKNLKNRDKTWSTKDQPLTSQSVTVEPSQPNRIPHYVRAPVPSTSQGTMPVPPLSGPNFSVGPTSFPEQAQQAGLLLNGLMMNMMQFQQQPNVPVPGSFQMNGMPWQMDAIVPLLRQQLLSQIPRPNLMPPQQQRNLSQLGSSSSPLGQVNYAGGPTMATNLPWLGPLGSNRPNQVNYAGGPTMFHGPMSSETQGDPSGNSQSAITFPMNADVRPPFNQGFSSGGGRGRRFFHPRGGGGRFDSRRARH